MAPAVHLVPFTLGDAAFVLRLLNTEGFLTHIGDKGVRSLEQAQDYLRSGPLASYATHGHGLMKLVRRDTGDALGALGLLRREGLDHPDLGYALLPEHAGRGYARAGARLALEDGHRRLGLATILAVVKAGNARSIRLLEALGFVDDGWVRLHADEPEDRRFRVGLPLRQESA